MTQVENLNIFRQISIIIECIHLFINLFMYLLIYSFIY